MVEGPTPCPCAHSHVAGPDFSSHRVMVYVAISVPHSEPAHMPATYPLTQLMHTHRAGSWLFSMKLLMMILEPFGGAGVFWPIIPCIVERRVGIYHNVGSVRDTLLHV